MKIFVAGSGKLASVLLTSGLSFPLGEMVKWETTYSELNEKAVVIHAGSGRQLDECIQFCSKTKSVLIELSTGLGTEQICPDFPLVICPNTSMLVLKTMNMMKKSGWYFENYEISITESHQSTKKSEPATAVSFAGSLKFQPEKIVSVKEPEIQLNKIGIPREFLDCHAYHKIVLKDGNDEVTIETKILGHESYAKGVKAIIEMLFQYDLENRKYTVFDLIDQGMIQ